jgi:hypothetical protein
MRKTKLEIIDETVKFYSKNTERRAKKNGLCSYLNEDGNKCAVGRCAKNPGELSNGPFNEVIEDLTDEEIFLPRYRGHDKEFWNDLQSLHDSDGYWDYNSLSKCGERRVGNLKNKWAK